MNRWKRAAVAAPRWKMVDSGDGEWRSGRGCGEMAAVYDGTGKMERAMEMAAWRWKTAIGLLDPMEMRTDGEGWRRGAGGNPAWEW